MLATLWLMWKKQVAPVIVLWPITPIPPSRQKFMNTTSGRGRPSWCVPCFRPMALPGWQPPVSAAGRSQVSGSSTTSTPPTVMGTICASRQLIAGMGPRYRAHDCAW